MPAADFPDPLRGLAARHGPRRAIVDRGAGYHVTWFDLDGLAHVWARRLEGAGLRAGERVAVLEPAGIRLAALLHACLRSGAALVPLSPQAPAAEMERVLADCRPRFLVRDGELEELETAPVTADPADVAILYTSGTTGPAKGVRLTLATHVASANGCREALNLSESDRWLLALAPHHVGGLAVLFRAVICNQQAVTLPRFEVGACLEALNADRPTVVSLVPTMLDQLLAAGGAEALRATKILIGGAPAPAQRVREWAALGLTVCPSYGLTETCSQVAVVPPGEAERLAGTSGRAGPQAALDVGEDGEIVVSGPCVSPGYVNRALAPAPGGGTFHTGDLGRLADGVLTVLGRRDDLILTGGESVQPEEVEAVLCAHPAVRDAAVAGRPDGLWGEVVGAWLVLEGEASEAQLRAWCRERLAGFKVPRRWTFVEKLPRSEGGKLHRRELS
ncbi:MAG: AMP-binding protein [Candidatus Dormibacteraeota bacterium]|nr:AMP-binding protein [Candidatus Dormibacteraeota bacterium]